MKKGVYLENIPLSAAIAKWRGKISSEKMMPLETERIPAGEALERITAEAVFARLSSPFYHAAAMDGYAVRFIDTFGASERSPKRLVSGSAGRVCEHRRSCP